MCRHMPPDASTFVTEAIPVLTNLLQYPDTKVYESQHSCLAWRLILLAYIYFTLILCLLYFFSGHWPCFCLFGSHSWIFCIIFWKARYALFTWLNCWGNTPYFGWEYWLFTNIAEQLNIYSLWCLLLKDKFITSFLFL